MSSNEGDEGPTGKYKAAPVDRARIQLPLPRPNVPGAPGTPAYKVPGPAPSSSDADDERVTNPPPRPSSSPKWEALLDRVLDDEGPDLELGDATESEPDEPLPSARSLSGLPRRNSGDRTAAPGRRTSVDKQPAPGRPQVAPVAPPPPRMPRLGPESEFSFGLEDPPIAEKSARLSPRMPSSEDLSFTPEGTADRPSPARPIQPLNMPSSIPLPLEAPREEAHVLVERASGFPPGLSRPDPTREMHERHALGDFTGALAIAEVLLQADPDDPDAASVASECRARLKQMYVSRLGGTQLVPSMAVPRSELKWLSLDHRAGFVLAQLDGTSTIEDIVDLAGMPELEVLRTLWELVSQRIIELKSPRGR